MKSTIKTGTRAITVQPSKLTPGSVCIELVPNPLNDLGMSATLTQDQIGALIFGLEQAAEAAEISQHRLTSVADGAAL